MTRAALLALLLAGCSGAPMPAPDAGPIDVGTDAGPDAFIALTADFEGYTSWQSYTIADPSSPIWNRTVWINQLPAHGATEFAQGTIIVRRFPDPTSATGYTQHAMAKRGAGFNGQDGGAHGWEWFELADGDAGVQIVWRGADQPDGGAGYNASAQTCNQCHGQFGANDFVQSAPLQLSGF
jgi:hypothetical protein